MSDIPKFWRKRTLLSYLLLPLSWLYFFITKIRYRHRKIGTIDGISVIIVGNLTVGGNGKTPVVIALAKAMTNHQIKVGIISRGYGGKLISEQLLTTESSADIVGDEPLLIFQETGVPVAVGRNRLAALRLVKKHHPDIQWIISDDGLQHYRLPRLKEWIVIAPDLVFGNELLLPAGPLRESIKRLNTADAIIFTGNPTQYLPTKVPQYTLTMKTSGFVNLEGKTVELEPPFYALTAIARPERFFQTLTRLGYTPTAYQSFPDHAPLPSTVAQFAVNGSIVMTMKDAVKITSWPTELKSKVVILRYETTLLPELLDNILNSSFKDNSGPKKCIRQKK
ncbi:tetraacyldisaccharide 4'-kinase [Suttonella ornithocola]|uniref:Tetraacyldisaccharide 4'-kinase n=1 Tax=Suttonella ornithocola TaxID=279832 RepID=A0A380MTG7_9GAMM|nr:tetraacyldisaccharide 4'-kinase [Suttonella ornithocola]SUO95484.1 Tetraacyldisaccharide 4'-kinase [Suttonella ornithocola]